MSRVSLAYRGIILFLSLVSWFLGALGDRLFFGMEKANVWAFVMDAPMVWGHVHPFPGVPLLALLMAISIPPLLALWAVRNLRRFREDRRMECLIPCLLHLASWFVWLDTPVGSVLGRYLHLAI